MGLKKEFKGPHMLRPGFEPEEFKEPGQGRAGRPADRKKTGLDIVRFAH